jgi:hypothetical protein
MSSFTGNRNGSRSSGVWKGLGSSGRRSRGNDELLLASLERSGWTVGAVEDGYVAERGPISA